jgi:Rrf2 family iron-sulfur cluster assembly transcriptional regulator
MFSKSCEYGIRAVIYIASQSLEHKRVKIREIAQMTNSPEAFTAKIVGALSKHNIVLSQKGPTGGLEIDIERMKNINISQIVLAIDGDSVYNGCGLGMSQCNAENPCPMHEKFAIVRAELKQMLETTTIFELATNLKDGKSTLLR